MAQLIQGFPEIFDHEQTATLSSVRYRLEFIWRDRTASWYFNLRTVDGVDLVLGRRVSPQWISTGNLLNVPLIGTSGLDAFERLDLGTEVLQVLHITQADLDALGIA